MTETPLLTYVEAGEYLRCSARSVQRLVEQGCLKPVYPLPRSPRICRQDLDEYIRSLHTNNRAGSGENPCQKEKIAMASRKEKTRHSGGQVLSMRAAKELDEVQARRKEQKQKRF